MVTTIPLSKNDFGYRYKCIVHKIESQIDKLLFSLGLFTGPRFVLVLCLHGVCEPSESTREESKDKIITHFPLRTLSLVLPFSIFSGRLRSRCLGCGREKSVQPTLLFCIHGFGKLVSAFTDAIFTNGTCQYGLYAIKDCRVTPHSLEPLLLYQEINESLHIRCRPFELGKTSYQSQACI